MPLFECKECHAVDNTALTNFWDAQLEGRPKLCSACDPAIKKWHGEFDKITAEEYRRRFPKGRPIEYPAAAKTPPGE